MTENAFRRTAAFLARHLYLVLIPAWLLSALIHFALILKTAEIPSVMGDELLYFDLARSIHDGTGVAVRGQNVFYCYLGYPLFLAPLFGLPESVNIYHAAIGLNCLTACAVCFPLCALSREITGRKAVSLMIALLSLLMPDLFLARHMMVESLSLPLLVTAGYVFLRTMKKPGILLMGLSGLLCAYLYAVKPGYLAPGGSYCAVLLLYGLRKKDRSATITALGTAAFTLLSILLYRCLLTLVFHIDTGILSLYDWQTEPLTFGHLLTCLKGMLAYFGYLPLGFCLFPAAAAVRGIRKTDDRRGIFAAAAVLGCALTLTGACYVIFSHEAVHNPASPTRIHLRYASAYLLLFLPYLYTKELKGARLRGILAALWAVMLACLALLPGLTSMPKLRYVADAPLLIGYLHTPDSVTAIWIAAAVLAALVALTVYVCVRGADRRFLCAITALIAAVFLYQSAADYRIDTFGKDKTLAADAREAAETVPAGSVYLCEDGDTYGYACMALDIAKRENIPPVTLGAMLDCTDDTGAVGKIYPEPLNGFIYSGNGNAYEPEYLVIKPDLLSTIKLNESEGPVTKTANGRYRILKLPSDGRWIMSGLSGLKDGAVTDDTRLTVYDPDTLASGGFEIRLKVKSDADGASLKLSSEGGAFRITPSQTGKAEWFKAGFTVSDPNGPFGITLTPEGGTITIGDFRIEPAN